MVYAIKNEAGMFVSITHSADHAHNYRWAELDKSRRKLFTKAQAELLLQDLNAERSQGGHFSICELSFEEVSRYSLDRGKSKCVLNPCLRYILYDPKSDKYITSNFQKVSDLYEAKLFATPRTARDFVAKTDDLEKNNHLQVLQIALKTA